MTAAIFRYARRAASSLPEVYAGSGWFSLAGPIRTSPHIGPGMATVSMTRAAGAIARRS